VRRRCDRQSKKELDVAGKDEKPKREGRLQRFFRETTGELRRVSWPSGPEARRLTMIVIVVLVIMALFLGLVDWGASAILGLALGV
jgi:preprotein translocase subunit SecE